MIYTYSSVDMSIRENQSIMLFDLVDELRPTWYYLSYYFRARDLYRSYVSFIYMTSFLVFRTGRVIYSSTRLGTCTALFSYKWK